MVKPPVASFLFIIKLYSMRRIFTIIFLLTATQIQGQTIWNTGSLTFTKTAPFQQDCITPNVCLTRGAFSVIYNEVTENFLDGDGDCTWTPGGTEWAFGTIANWSTLTYQPLYVLHGCAPPTMVNQPMVLHLIQDNIYLQLTFSFWGGSSANGNYTYTRTTTSTLGFDLLSFNATAKGRTIALDWATANEDKSLGFYLQRSIDGISFEELTFIPTKGNGQPNSYGYTDLSANPGKNFYRLKQTHIDGGFEYSKIISGMLINDHFQLYPNPATEKVVLSKPFSKSTVKVVSTLGTLVKEARVQNGIFDISDLQSGVYYLVITNGLESVTERMVKL